jgi:hypothetical protein
MTRMTIVAFSTFMLATGAPASAAQAEDEAAIRQTIANQAATWFSPAWAPGHSGPRRGHFVLWGVMLAC